VFKILVQIVNQSGVYRPAFLLLGMNYQTIIGQLESASAQQERKSTVKVLDLMARIFSQLKERKFDIKSLKSHTSAIQEALQSSDLSFGKVTKLKNSLTQTLMKDHGLTTKGYYQGLWMVLGMSVFGMPFGTILGLSLNNFGLFGIGLPIGMVIGMAIGAQKDKKAKEEGKVLEV